MSQLTCKNAVVMQFGTSRFLQAHVDYFIDKSNTAGHTNTALVVVQSSPSMSGLERVKAMNSLVSYPVHIQGIKDGQVIDVQESVVVISKAYQADAQWVDIVACFCEQVTHVVSNTADQGYLLNKTDKLASAVPRSFPAKLLVLLKARFEHNQKPVTIMPCELVANNGSVLKDIVLSIAAHWQLNDDLVKWLTHECWWVNSLVDRIVSQSIEPLGAVAEPYALWAIERQPGLVLPCQHVDVRLVDNLLAQETLKLCVLNLSHSFLVDVWMQQEESTVRTVGEAMQDSFLRSQLDKVLQEEVLPVLLQMQLGEDVHAYLIGVIERFCNPFLQHKLMDIGQNHQAKVARRILPLVQQAAQLLPELAMPRLRQCLLRNSLIEG